ncbi:beta-eliminating lyase-related protein [Marinicella sp. S1101]|nr:beta-eliminating lyase-related protein [Marinicella marina]MCX7553833.1 beta-eliminating lyase-related protein [Marinicella marina]MDJ1140909.1 beta-eliminating lyase-related protein [Marinicella marina]
MSPKTHEQWLNIMNASRYTSYECDIYNQGPLVELIENKMAQKLAKPKALFFNKGTVCQLAALKTICEKQDNPLIAIHPQSHIAIDEDLAYQHVTQLKAASLGAQGKPIVSADLDSLTHTPAVLVIEMPLRRAGFKLAEWHELKAIRQWCDANQVHLHMDGARIWESAPYYQLDVADISQLFDSVYVSLYKGIGGLSGALLAGDEALITDCGIWRNRLGSQMWSNFPALITGLEGIDKQLPKIKSWVLRAPALADCLSAIEGLEVDTPQTNGFLIRTTGDCAELNQRLDKQVKQTNISPCKPWSQENNSSKLYTEIQIGADHNKISDDELFDFFNQLINP